MRVLYIMPWIRQGGAEADAVYSAYYLSARNHQTAILCLFYNLSHLDSVSFNLSFICPPWYIQRILEKSKFLTYFLGPWILLYLFLRRALEFDVYHPHSLPAPWVCVIGVAIFRAFGYKNASLERIFWLCNEPPRQVSLVDLKYIGLLDWLMWFIASSIFDQWVCSKIKNITVYSSLVGSQVQQRYHRSSQLIRLGVAPLFSLPPIVDFKKTYNLSSKIVLLMVGRLHPQKNQRLGLGILAELLKYDSRFFLVLVGRGPDEEFLRKEVSRLGVLDNVLFFGQASPQQSRDWYYSCDLVLYPSVNQAGAINQSWGLVPFEALTCGKLTLVSQNTGSGEWYGQLFPQLILPPEISSFADKVRELISHPVKLDLKTIRQNLHSDLSWENYACLLEKWLFKGQ